MSQTLHSITGNFPKHPTSIATSTFHVFPRLPLELRILIWESTTVQDRVVKIKIKRRDSTPRHYWSPTRAPAVTRACRESRRHSSYRQTFTTDGSPRYIWVDMDHDILQMHLEVMNSLVSLESQKIKEIRHLRLEPIGECNQDESTWRFHSHSHGIRNFTQLERCDVLVNGDLYRWAMFIKESYWGPSCLESSVRMIDAKTGEWVDSKTSGAYQDYFDTSEGETKEYTRYVNFDYESDEADGDERFEAMQTVMPLTRIDLNLLRLFDM